MALENTVSLQVFRKLQTEHVSVVKNSSTYTVNEAVSPQKKQETTTATTEHTDGNHWVENTSAIIYEPIHNKTKQEDNTPANANGSTMTSAKPDTAKVKDTAPIIQSNNRGQGDGNSISHPESTVPEPKMDERGAPLRGKRAAYITVATLLFINLLNYMDRYTVAGVLKDIQKYYKIDNSEAGLIQTAFVCAYMVFSPIFGYMGDRYTRKYIMAVGIFLWSGFTLFSSFIGPDHFWAFVLLRALVGIGEASYSTIAPTIIADLFAKEMRTRMLMIFYFAIPVGSGLGYIVGANIAQLFHQWQFALRVTPELGVICVVLILLFCQEPERGMSEGGEHLRNTTFLTDLKSLVKNKSFIFSTLGFTCVTFVTGALALWAPTFMDDAIVSMTLGGKSQPDMVALVFGALTVAGGIVGVALGAQMSQFLRKRNPRADPLICAFGMLICTPFIFFALIMAKFSIPITWVLIFVGLTLLCLNWAVTADILLYVVIPTRRSTAEAIQILFSHALGDAGSPYLIGLVADALAPNFKGDRTDPPVQFVTLQYSLYLTTVICVLSGGFYLATAIYIQQDKKTAEKQTRDMQGIFSGTPEALNQDLIINSDGGMVATSQES